MYLCIDYVIEHYKLLWRNNCFSLYKLKYYICRNKLAVCTIHRDFNDTLEATPRIKRVFINKQQFLYRKIGISAFIVNWEKPYVNDSYYQQSHIGKNMWSVVYLPKFLF